MSLQLPAAMALAVLYVGVSLALGGTHPGSGMPWWFLVPVSVSFCTAFLAEKMAAVLPVPWALDGRVEAPPRRVHLSWRAALRIPSWMPLLLLPWHFLWILRLHFDRKWVASVAALIGVAALAVVASRRLGELRILRSGEAALAVVTGRSCIGEAYDRIAYRFALRDGTAISDTAWDLGYGVREGSTLPVFYEASNPARRVVACECWFEAD